MPRPTRYVPRVLRVLFLALCAACAPKPAPPPASAPPSAGLVEVAGAAARAPVREQLLRTLATATAAPCYTAALTRDPRAYGEIVLAFTVLADGSVDAVEVRLSTLADPEAEACVAAAVRALAFPGVTAERLTVVYPFVFTSDATPPVVARALKVKYGLLPPAPEGDPADPRAEAPPGVVYLW